MAQGDVTVYDDTIDELLQGNLGDLATDDIRIAFTTSTFTPAAGDALPYYTGGTGTTAISNETTGGVISAGGYVFTTEAVNGISGGANFDTEDISIAANGSNPSAVRWGMLYNNTLASKRGFAFLDFGTDQSFVSGFTITINASGWFQIT